MARLSILAPTRYPWRFNGPRQSRHDISIRNFIPFNKISPRIEGVTVFNPLPPKRFDLVHAFNRLPLGTTPFVISFESHLPRGFGIETSALFKTMTDMLLSPRCRGIIAISDYARRQFLNQHRGNPRLAELEARLTVLYPNIAPPELVPTPLLRKGDEIRFVFVGNHFGRKGGSAAVRLAERARRDNLPWRFDIVSTLEVGGASWVGPTRGDYWRRDLELARTLPNVRLHLGLPNTDVLRMTAEAHFSLLPTFSDSFGYSAIESMACGTPVVATGQCALPEFIRNDDNGILLNLATDAMGEWAHIGRADRSTPAYETAFESEVERLAGQADAALRAVLGDPPAYAAMRQQARRTAETLFSAAKAAAFLDDYYEEALSRMPRRNL